jgi:hypothetical protein
MDTVLKRNEMCVKLAMLLCFGVKPVISVDNCQIDVRMIALLDPELLEQQYPLLQLPDEQGFELEHDENVQIKPDAC